MLNIKKISKKDRWRLTAFEVMKYNPKFRNTKGHYIKKEWTEFEIGKSFDGVVLTYQDYKNIEDKYISVIKYIFGYYNCDKIQFVKAKYFMEDDELHLILDKELETFYKLLINRKTLDIKQTQMAARLILRSALSGMFHCKINKNIAVRFGYDFYMYINVPPNDEKEIKTYIEENIGLFTTR
jgi:hypothetical protein